MIKVWRILLYYDCCMIIIYSCCCIYCFWLLLLLLAFDLGEVVSASAARRDLAVGRDYLQAACVEPPLCMVARGWIPPLLASYEARTQFIVLGWGGEGVGGPARWVTGPCACHVFGAQDLLRPLGALDLFGPLGARDLFRPIHVWAFLFWCSGPI